MTTYWSKRSTRVAFARQSDLVTENTSSGDFTTFYADFDPPSLEREVEDFAAASVGQYGGSAAPIDGRKKATFTMRFPYAVLPSTYDPTSETPGSTAGILPPEAVMLANALGSKGSSAVASAANFATGTHLYSRAYLATEIAGAGTTSTLQVTDATQFAEGEFVVADSSVALANPAYGWITDADATPTPDELTLLEAGPNAAVTNDNCYPVAVATLTGNERVPLTIQLLGGAAKLNYVMIGCIPTACTITSEAGKPPMVELTMIAFGGFRRDSSLGALSTGTQSRYAEPLIGRFGGRLTFGGAVLCGVRNLSIALTWEPHEIMCYSAAEGVVSVVMPDPTSEITMQVPLSTDETITDSESDIEQLLSNQSSISLAVYSASAIGKVVAIVAPSLYLTAQPSLEDVDGVLYYGVAARLGAYSGDTGTTAPADTLLRAAWS